MVMKYRQYFGLSWQEYLDTPPKIFFSDLDMISIENEAERDHQTKIQNTKQE